jgi:hypothetical protein
VLNQGKSRSRSLILYRNLAMLYCRTAGRLLAVHHTTQCEARKAISFSQRLSSFAILFKALFDWVVL